MNLLSFRWFGGRGDISPQIGGGGIFCGPIWKAAGLREKLSFIARGILLGRGPRLRGSGSWFAVVSQLKWINESDLDKYALKRRYVPMSI
jgi:hypothetical protein